MTGRDIVKLMNAGYRVFRLREQDKSIWESTFIPNVTNHVSWKLFERFETQKAAKEAFQNLMSSEKFIEG